MIPKCNKFHTIFKILLAHIPVLSGDLIDTTDVRHNDIVPGAQLHLEVWSMWRSIVEAAATNDTDWVIQTN